MTNEQYDELEARLRAEAGMAHGDGVEDSLEWKAADAIATLRERATIAEQERDELDRLWHGMSATATRLSEKYDRAEALIGEAKAVLQGLKFSAYPAHGSGFIIAVDGDTAAVAEFLAKLEADK